MVDKTIIYRIKQLILWQSNLWKNASMAGSIAKNEHPSGASWSSTRWTRSWRLRRLAEATPSSPRHCSRAWPRKVKSSQGSKETGHGPARRPMMPSSRASTTSSSQPTWIHSRERLTSTKHGARLRRRTTTRAEMNKMRSPGTQKKKSPPSNRRWPPRLQKRVITGLLPGNNPNLPKLQPA